MPSCSPLSRRSWAAAASLAGRPGPRPASPGRSRRARRRRRSPLSSPSSSRGSTAASTRSGGGLPAGSARASLRTRRSAPGGRPGATCCQVASPTCSTTTSAPWPPVASFTAATTSCAAWFTLASARPRRPLELLVARGRDDRPRAESLGRSSSPPSRRRRRYPRRGPIRPPEPCARDEHAVGGLEDERERGSLLEAQAVGNRIDVRRRHGDELGVCPVRVLADDRDLVAVLDARVDHDAPSEAVGRRRAHDAGAVGAEDARLGDGGPALTDPEVEVIQRGRAQLDEDVARRRARDRARPRTGARRARRPRGSGSPSSPRS